MEKNIWRPSKTFVKSVIKFPGSNFGSLYGKGTISDSDYIFLYDKGFDKRPLPYLIGEDGRSAGEIWKSIEPAIIDRAKEMLEKDIVRSEWDSETDYVGKLQRGCAFIAKELLLPKDFRKEVEKRKELQKKEPYMPMEGAVFASKSIVDLEQQELFYKKLARVLGREGTELGNKTVVDIEMLGHNVSYPHTVELMERAIGVLKDHNYNLESLHLSGFTPYADIDKLIDSKIMFVGEVKLIEPLLPCGKTSRQKNREYDEINKKYDEERKRGLHKTYTRSGIDERRRKFTTHIIPSPRIPCSFIKGQRQCAPGGCGNLERGKLVKRDSEKKNENLLGLDENQIENVNDVASLVSRLYKAFDMLKEKEKNYR
jgi:hypothetical protein